MATQEGLGTALGSGIGSLFGQAEAGGFFGGAIGGLFGRKRKRVKAVDIRTGAFFAQVGERGTTISRGRTPFKGLGPEQQKLFRQLEALKGRVGGSIGELTKAAITSIRRSRDQRLGNLRDQLQRRGILGSSFGEAQQASENLAFGEVEAKVRAESIFQELELTRNFITQQQETLRSQIQVDLQELGFALGASQAFINGNDRANAIEMELAARNAEGFGEFAGDIFGASESPPTETPPPAPPETSSFGGDTFNRFVADRRARGF